MISAATHLKASGGSNQDNPTNLGLTDFSGVATTLDTNNAQKFTTGIEGENRFGTGPIRPSYIMLSSTELQTDFDALTGQGVFNSWNYPSTISAMPNEWGSVYNLRILTSSEAAVSRGTSANGQDVYMNVVLGKQAVTHIRQDQDTMRMLYRGPEFSGYLMQNASLAIRFSQSQAITQDTAIRVLESTRLSSGPSV